jgi:uncharacterized protein (DUF1778 family)
MTDTAAFPDDIPAELRTERVTIRLEPELRRAVRAAAARESRSESGFVRKALVDRLSGEGADG